MLFPLLLILFCSSAAAMCKPTSAASRPYDLVIYGATGFTGQLAAEYVQTHYPNLKFALAGRNRSKLEKLHQKIGGDQSDIPLIVADAVRDTDAMDKLAASTRVIANYAGSPYVDKALPVVEACVKHGTCYTDITGEVNFQRASYDRYHKQALASKALIVHACGYDSVPSDIGAMLAANAMKDRHDCDCQSIQLVAGDTRGGASGGTIHTGLSMAFGGKDEKLSVGMKEARARGSYGLDPDGCQGGPDESDSVSFVHYDELSKSYVMPFIMATLNAPVVRKSNALLGYPYGRNCSYREVQAVPGYVSGLAGMMGLGVFGMLLVFPPTRWLLTKYVLPKPGQGPSKELQESGYFTSHVYAVGNKPEKPVTVAYVKSGNAGDPGYKATARMSIEASLCMALEREKCAPEGGVLTPATGLGMTLVERLNKSGMELGVVE